jgi:hypothetical protein
MILFTNTHGNDLITPIGIRTQKHVFFSIFLHQPRLCCRAKARDHRGVKKALYALSRTLERLAPRILRQTLSQRQTQNGRPHCLCSQTPHPPQLTAGNRSEKHPEGRSNGRKITLDHNDHNTVTWRWKFEFQLRFLGLQTYLTELA